MTETTPIRLRMSHNRTKTEGVWEKGAEENVWTTEG
jgi:hypothetical protein